MCQRYVGLAHIVHGMRTQVWVARAAMILAGVTVAACARHPDRRDDHPAGTADHPPHRHPGRCRVAGHPDTEHPAPGFPGNTNVPVVPAPPNALTMQCSDFNKLDQATQLAVIRAILAQQNNPLGPSVMILRRRWPSTMCEFMPDRTVREILPVAALTPARRRRAG